MSRRHHSRASTALVAVLLAVAAGLLPAGATTAHAFSASEGPVAKWPADGDAHEVAGGHDGTPVNGAGFAAGALGQAFSFDGVDDFVEAPDSPAWDFGSGDFTIALWARFASLEPSSIEQPAAVFIGHDEGPGSQSKWFFALGGGRLYFHVNSPALGPRFLALAPFAPELNRWYHLAVTRAAGTYRIYVDGAEVSSETDANAVPDAAAPLTIGQAESALGAPEQFFMNGRLDESQIYDRAISASELEALAAKADLSLTKTDAPDPVTVGGELTYTLTVRNDGPDAAESVDVSDSLPAGVRLISAATRAGSCSGTTPIACDLGTLSKDATATVTIVVEPQSSGNLENEASASSTTSDPNSSNNTGAAPTRVDAATPPANKAALRVAIVDSPDPVTVGDDLTYAITVTNDGPDTAEQVTLTDTLPGGVTFVSAATNQGGCTGSATVVCALGSLVSGASATVTIVVRPTAAGSLETTATASSDTDDPDTGDNRATETTTASLPPQLSADLAISAKAEPNPVVVGEELVYTLTVESRGPEDATGVEVTNELPPNVNLVSAGSTRGDCETDPTLVCRLGDLARGANAVVTVRVRPSSIATLVNRASVTGTRPDADTSNQHVELTTYVGDLPRGRITLDTGTSPFELKPRIFYRSDEGAANRLTVTQEGNRYVFTDLGVTIGAPRSCVVLSSHSASCYSSFWETAPLRLMAISLADRDDTAALDVGGQVWPTGPTSPPQLTVGGGPGNDVLETARGGGLFGQDGADLLIAEGSVGATLDGGAGPDQVLGGAGPDEITGGDGDFVNAQEGDDHVLVVHGYPDDPGRATFYGGGGSDVVDFSARQDRLVLRLGRDSVVTAPDGSSDFVAADFEGVMGGKGEDVLIGAAGRPSYIAGGPTGPYDRLGGPGDRLVGLDGDDHLVGSVGNDEIYGGPGDDRLEGGDGQDKLYGAVGDDVLQGGHLNDRMEGGPGIDLVDYSDYGYGRSAPFDLPYWSPYGPNEGVRVDLAASGHHDGGFYDGGPACPLGPCHEYEGLHDLISQVENVRGTPFSDTLRGTDGRNVIEGLGGNDVIEGRGDDDTLVGGADTDWIKGGTGDDRIDPGDGPDSVDAGSGDDLIDAFDGFLDRIWGGDGLDRVWADALDDLSGVEVKSDRSVLHPSR